MAFPGTVTVVDDFARGSYPNPVYAGAGSTLWQAASLQTGSSPLSASSPGVAGAQNGGSGGDTMVSLSTYGADFRLIWDVATTSSGYFAFYFGVDPGGAGTFPASALTALALWVGITSANTWDFHRYNPTAVTLGSAATQTVASGSSIGIERVGTTLNAYYKAPAGSWGAPTVTATDSTFNRIGYVGFEPGDTTITMDAFSTGTMDPAGASATPVVFYSGASYAASRAATI